MVHSSIRQKLANLRYREGHENFVKLEFGGVRSKLGENVIVPGY